MQSNGLRPDQMLDGVTVEEIYKRAAEEIASSLWYDLWIYLNHEMNPFLELKSNNSWNCPVIFLIVYIISQMWSELR